MSSEYRLIQSTGELSAAATELSSCLADAEEKRLYLDTEFESNRSGTQICLLQISAGKTNFVVDTLSVRDLSILGPLLSDPAHCWVLHAGLQDVDLIVEAAKIPRPTRLFDTQIAWALTTAEASVGLAYLQFKLLGVRSKKAHQADDWVRRPLQQSQLRYAASDVDYLPPMTELLMSRADALGRVDIVMKACREALSPLREPPAPLSLASFRNAWQLGARSQAALLYLVAWFNRLPPLERRHAPENKAFLSIASRLPEDVGALSRIKGVPRNFVGKHGREVVDGLKKAAEEAQTEDFVPIDPPPYLSFEEIRLDAWLSQMRATLSISEQFSPEFVLPQRLVRRMKTALTEEGLDEFLASLVGWRHEFLHEKMQQFCDLHPPPL